MCICVILFSKQIVIVKFLVRSDANVRVGVSSFIYAKCYRHSFTILSELVCMCVYVCDGGNASVVCAVGLQQS